MEDACESQEEYQDGEDNDGDDDDAEDVVIPADSADDVCNVSHVDGFFQRAGPREVDESNTAEEGEEDEGEDFQDDVDGKCCVVDDGRECGKFSGKDDVQCFVEVGEEDCVEVRCSG